ncbi:hypothetical protein [Sporolactobacillus pectinivorans]|uniref:hypothetical protein n=1 Tax=Sporolactobacillus pectinivorans TaxID=1591408 RepID=UPI000C267FF0|nr:hypothetical protein [Sporolactobacillus pectinivorans]
MHRNYTLVGEHTFDIQTDSANLMTMYTDHFRCSKQAPKDPVNMTVRIHSGYGTFKNKSNYSTIHNESKLIFRQDDYLIDIENDYRSANLYVYNTRALKRAFEALYCLFVTHCGWGIMIRGSFVDGGRKVRIMSGSLGNRLASEGFGTEALEPAALIKVSQEGATVFSTSFNNTASGNVPLESILLFHQSFQDMQVRLSRTKALIQLIDYVLYWPNNTEQMRNVISMLKQLVAVTPTYQRYFNNHRSVSELTS